MGTIYLIDRGPSNPAGGKCRLEVIASGVGLKIEELSGNKQPFNDFSALLLKACHKKQELWRVF